ncbi:MAG: TolC family protein [Acidobacteriota bacterium]
MALFLSVSAGAAVAQAGGSAGPPAQPSAPAPLTLRQAVDRALGLNPQGEMARADAAAAKAAAGLARTQLLPQLNFTEDISRGNDPVYVFGERLRQRQFTQADFALNALNRPLPIGNFATRFTGSWMGFDSWRTEHQIHRADLARQGADAGAMAANQGIVLRVVQAYQSVLYAERQVDVAAHEQQTAQALLTDVTQHVNAGLAVDSDRMAAEVNAAARRQDLIAAQGNLDVAWAELSTAMGDDLQSSATAPARLAPIEPQNFPSSTLADELAMALKNRPDLAALNKMQQAQGQALAAARSSFGPTVSAYGNWEEDRGSLTTAGGNNWVAGVQVNLDILPLGKRAQLAGEHAAAQKANAELTQARQQLRLQVSQAHIQRRTAELSLDTARAAMDQAAESLRIVRNRYGAGLATITDLLRAEDAGRQSQSNYWRAVYGNATAYAALLYAEGVLTPDAAEGLQ